MTLSELQARAAELGLTRDFVKTTYGGLKKQHWETAIMNREAAETNAALAKEAEEENRKAAVQRAYKSPSAPFVVPVAYGLAYGEAVTRGIGRILNRN